MKPAYEDKLWFSSKYQRLWYFGKIWLTTIFKCYVYISRFTKDHKLYSEWMMGVLEEWNFFRSYKRSDVINFRVRKIISVKIISVEVTEILYFNTVDFSEKNEFYKM